MAIAWTTSNLLTEVRLRARLSDADPDWTDARLLSLGDTIISERFTALVASNRGGDYIRAKDFTLVAGTRNYSVPSRALADCLEGVYAVKSDGTETPLGQISRIDGHASYSSTGGFPLSYYVEGSDVVTGWDATTSGYVTLRVRYTTRRSAMTTIGDKAFVITSINTGTKSVGFTGTVPSEWTAYSTVTAYLDLIAAASPFTFMDIDRVVTGYAQIGPDGSIGSTGSALPTGLAIGDYAAVGGYTCTVQLPPELYNSLANAIAGEVLMYLRDAEGSDRLRASSAQGMAAYLAASARKVRDESIPIVNTASPLRLRSRGLVRRGWLRV